MAKKNLEDVVENEGSTNASWPPILVRINPKVMELMKFHKERTGNSVTSMARTAIETYVYDLELRYQKLGKEDPDE